MRGAVEPAAAGRLDDGYLPLVALAKYGGLSIRTLRGYLRDRVHPLPHYRVGGKILVRRSEFDVWLTQFKVADNAVSVDALVDDIVETMR